MRKRSIPRKEREMRYVSGFFTSLLLASKININEYKYFLRDVRNRRGTLDYVDDDILRPFIEKSKKFRRHFHRSIRFSDRGSALSSLNFLPFYVAACLFILHPQLGFFKLTQQGAE